MRILNLRWGRLVAALVFSVSALFVFESAAHAARKEEKKKREKDPFAASTGGFILQSTSQEIRLGQEVKQQVLKQYKLYEDSALVSYVRRIGAKLASYADRQNVQYEFYVLDDPLVNAFALPGGTIFITRGILTVFNNEAELAGVLGHELSHVVERHSMKQMTGATVLDLAWKVYSKGQAMPLGYQIGADLLLFKPYGRGDELKSDALGLKYSYLAGYQANEVAHVFEEFQKREEFHTPAFFRSHPVDAARIKQIRELWDLIQTRTDFKPGAAPPVTGAEAYEKEVGPHSFRIFFPQVRAAYEEMQAAVGRKDLDGVMRVVDKSFKSRWLNLDREKLRKSYEQKFSAADTIQAAVEFREYRFLDRDAISALCRETETRRYADGRTEEDTRAQVVFFVKRAEKETDGPPWRLARIEEEGKW
ncbi:MAG: hypothetical protein A3G34_01540 [Candidatus Lindowbacteria bacterium RIFCSPLOWO2_12_FULL_62_27]|nr:MAG: hypothetical protein A3G34_01540 [Candidatus Lindowbacteria bacterium RIFCSPLOWO2_12_FULL_62_27]